MYHFITATRITVNSTGRSTHTAYSPTPKLVWRLHGLMLIM